MFKLQKMGHKDFDSYVEYAISNYANEKVKAGNYSPDKDPLALAKKEFDQLLPQGLESEHQYLFSLINETGDNVGVIWFMKKPENKSAYICDFVVWPEYRGTGYGKAAMLALEEEVKTHGVTKIALHVFGHNTSAIDLYKKLGYEATNITMAKEL